MPPPQQSGPPPGYYEIPPPGPPPGYKEIPPPIDPNDPLKGAFQATGIGPHPSLGPWSSTAELGRRVLAMLGAGAPSGSVMAEATGQRGTTPEGMRLLAPEELIPNRAEHPMAKAGAEFLGGLTTPTNIALLAGTGGMEELPLIAKGLGFGPKAASLLPRLMSLGFGGQMLKGAYDQYPEFKKAMDEGDINGALYHFTHGILGGAMSAFSFQHGLSAKPGTPLDHDESAHIDSIIEEHVATLPEAERDAARADLKEVKDEFNRAATVQQQAIAGQLSEVPKDATSVQGEPIREQPPARGEGPTPPPSPEGGEQAIRPDTGTPRGEGDLSPDALLRAEQERARREAAQRELEGEPEIERLRRLSSGSQEPIPPTPEELANEADRKLTTEAQTNLLEESRAQLHTLLPDFTKAIGGGEEGAATIPEPTVTGATGTAEPPPPPPVISPVADSDLADHGVEVTRPGPDIGWIEKYGGSMTEMVRRLASQGHPLSPTLVSLTRAGVDAIKGMMKDTIDTLGGWKRDAKRVVSDREWQEQVVPLLKNPDVDIRTRPPDVPDNVWQAYMHTRPMLEDLRVRMRDAIRIRLLKVGLKPEYIEEKVPDDWGIPFGYYPGIFEGDYAITKLMDIDEKGKENWQPIETGWRDTSEAKAVKKAADYMQDNPGTRVRVRKDTYTLPGKDFSSRAKLIDLAGKLKDADGEQLDDLVKDLHNEAAAAAYGPTRIAPKQYGHALKRETDLPGGATDMESFERFIQGSIRFIHLTPAREVILKLRNQIAEVAGMPEIQRPTDIPSTTAYSTAKQYPNILSRTDQFISGVEGRPGFSDVEIRSALNSIGADPSFMSRVSRAVQTTTALLKLGFAPVKVLSHGLQSLWAGLPVLGPRYVLEGYAHAYNPEYNDLIRSIAPSEPRFNPIVGGLEALGNIAAWKGSPNSLVDALHSYEADYFSRGVGPIDFGKGILSLVRDIGMSPFAAGIETTRRMAAVGAYRRALDRDLPEAQARDAASADVDRISGLYHAADNPTILRHLPGPIAQFKTFSFKTAQMMYGFRTPAEWTYFLGAIGILGFAGIPFAKPLSGLALALTGEDVENDLKRKYPLISRGIFGALGVDIPPGVGVGDLGLTRPQAPLGGILGPAGSDIYSLAKGGAEKLFKPESRIADQDLRDAIRNLSPAFRRLLDEGARSASNPSTIDPHTGSTILEHLTPLERLELGIGFTPIRVAEERESHEYIRNLIANEKDKRGFFVDRMAENALELSRSETTPDRQAAIIKETIALGRMAGEYGVGMNLSKAVIERAKEMEIDRLTRDILKAPKAVRPEIYEEWKRFKALQGEE